MAHVVSLKQEKKNAGQKLEGFMTRNRAILLPVLIVLLLAVIAVCVAVGLAESRHKKGLAALDAIEYAYTRDAASLSDEEIVARQNTALEALSPYLEQKNVVGMHANKMAADIAFAKGDFSASLDRWLSVAEAGKKTYLAAIGYYNAAVCCEELGNLADAESYYASAAAAKDFLLETHALFNVGRIQEQRGDYAAAAETYQSLVDGHTSDYWASLAQSRISALRIKGSI